MRMSSRSSAPRWNWKREGGGTHRLERGLMRQDVADRVDGEGGVHPLVDLVESSRNPSTRCCFLVCATTWPSRILQISDDPRSIEPGAGHVVVPLAGNPTRCPSAIVLSFDEKPQISSPRASAADPADGHGSARTPDAQLHPPWHGGPLRGAQRRDRPGRGAHQEAASVEGFRELSARDRRAGGPHPHRPRDPRQSLGA